jgi:adenine-specific DNA methylase
VKDSPIALTSDDIIGYQRIKDNKGMNKKVVGKDTKGSKEFNHPEFESFLKLNKSKRYSMKKNIDDGN